MKILVLGDIHGRDCWKDIIDYEKPDKVVFLGDYVSTHENISQETQILNLENILKYKEENADKVILLRGNHDMQHLGYYWAECSGYFRNVAQYMSEIKDRFLEDTQWIYIYDNIIFSHAGISKRWLTKNRLLVENINSKKPSEIFAFTPDTPFDMYGESETQPCTWIRPGSLASSNIKGYTQVVGHTPVRSITDIYKATKYNEHIYLCDNLPHEYLVIEDNDFIVRKNNSLIKLENREGLLYLKKEKGYYKLLAPEQPYILEYMRVIYDENSNIIAVDPSGGPFMDIGYKVNDMSLTQIKESGNGIELYFKKDEQIGNS